MDLKQQELKEWQDRNFPRSRYEVLSKKELIDIIFTLQVTLGICEEAGEIAHHVLKGVQGIREGINGIDKEQIADGVGDTLIYSEQLLSALNIDAEKELPKIIDTVLSRNWIEQPKGPREEVEQSAYCQCLKIPIQSVYLDDDGIIHCVVCKKPLDGIRRLQKPTVK